jgi:hypothetical protein
MTGMKTQEIKMVENTMWNVLPMWIIDSPLNVPWKSSESEGKVVSSMTRDLVEEVSTGEDYTLPRRIQSRDLVIITNPLKDKYIHLDS